jgi:hypothetical protein
MKIQCISQNPGLQAMQQSQAEVSAKFECLHLRSFNSSQQLHFDFQVLERTQTLGVEHVNSGDVTEM